MSRILSLVVAAAISSATAPTAQAGFDLIPGNGASNSKVVFVNTELTPVATGDGTCKVVAKTVVRTSKPNTWLKYVVVDSYGHKSAVKTAKTEGNKIAILTDHWEIPNAPGLDVGWVQIAGTAPIFISDREVYKMNCMTPIEGIKG
ncbi:MAG: hypothetical protein GKR99_12665 [Rhodobacteraceae bacterium]|nr:hypothetical protein [Paracoccaceae bacterium]